MAGPTRVLSHILHEQGIPYARMLYMTHVLCCYTVARLLRLGRGPSGPGLPIGIRGVFVDLGTAKDRSSRNEYAYAERNL